MATMPSKATLIDVAAPRKLASPARTPRQTLPFWRRAVLAALRVQVSYEGAAELLYKGGRVIVVSEHRSMLDGPLVALASPRPLHFAVNTRHARDHVAISRLLRWMERRGLGTVVPVDRASVFGMRQLRRALLAGDAICIFPAGRIAVGDSLPAQPGYAWLAVETGASVVEVRIEGAERSRI